MTSVLCILHMLHVAGLLCQAGSCEVGGGAASLASLAGSVPGVPGEDYPVLAAPPLTAFSCADKVAGGYYADTEARCQGEDVVNNTDVSGPSFYAGYILWNLVSILAVT